MDEEKKTPTIPCLNAYQRILFRIKGFIKPDEEEKQKLDKRNSDKIRKYVYQLNLGNTVDFDGRERLSENTDSEKNRRQAQWPLLEKKENPVLSIHIGNIKKVADLMRQFQQFKRQPYADIFFKDLKRKECYYFLKSEFKTILIKGVKAKDSDYSNILQEIITMAEKLGEKKLMVPIL